MTYGLKGTEQFARSLFDILDAALREKYIESDYEAGYNDGSANVATRIEELLMFHITDLNELGSVLCKLDCERRNEKYKV